MCPSQQVVVSRRLLCKSLLMHSLLMNQIFAQSAWCESLCEASIVGAVTVVLPNKTSKLMDTVNVYFIDSL